MPPTPEVRPPLPPFTRESAAQKVRLAEDGWNSRDPERVSLVYTSDSQWRNRAEFFSGRDAIVQFLKRKWAKELDYRLIKELWAFHEARIAVRFAYEWHDDSGNWFRSYGNENWEFNAQGLMQKLIASINDCRSGRRIGNFAGRSDAVRTIIQRCPNWDCDAAQEAADAAVLYPHHAQGTNGASASIVRPLKTITGR